MERLKRFKGAIFDLDGTLLDSLNVWKDVDELFFKERHLILPDDYFDTVNNMTFRETAQYTIERFQLDDSPEELMKQWQDMVYQAYASSISFIDGAKTFLSELKALNIHLGIATTLDLSLVKACLNNHNLWDWFEAITTIQEVNHNKSYPDIYLKTAEKLALPSSQCVVFEDLPMAIRGAKLGGFYTVLVNSKELDDLADLTISSFHDLLKS